MGGDAFAAVLAAVGAADGTVTDLIARETSRQHATLDLIASESIPSQAVRDAQGSILGAKTAEGYPGHRYHTGCEVVDELERVTIERACRLFGAEHANVQPNSGVNANLAVYRALLEPGDRVVAMELAHGGHLSHGAKASVTGAVYDFRHYGVRPDDERIDLDAVREVVREHRPKLVIAGGSSYPRAIDYPRLREIADEVGARLMVDLAHISGLVAAGVVPSPLPHADVVTMTTYKTLLGPHGGLILARAGLGARIDRAVFPGTQGTPAFSLMAGKAVCLGQAARPEFRLVQERIVATARAMADAFARHGIRSVTGGTDTHLVLIDLRSVGVTGDVAEAALASAGILANRNVIPFDPLPPTVTSGLRFGTTGAVLRGLGPEDLEAVAELVATILRDPGEATIGAVRAEIARRVAASPLWGAA